MPQTETLRPRTQDVQNLNASALIDLILETHHEFARATLARITAAAPGVVTAWQERDPRMPKVLEAIAGLEQEMLAHLQREERVLFPIVKEIEASPENSDAEVGAMLGPIICMKREHGFIDEMLAYLRTLTDDFKAPMNADAGYRQMLADLAAFEADTVEHVRKENEILFPKAMEMAPPVR
jgi:regulator of cell morphogenesis and NO signaling